MATLEQAEKLISIFKGVSTEKMQAILASGLIADIRDCDVSKVDREDFKKYIGLSNILEFLGTVNIPARASEFVVKDRFVVNTSDDALVKICGLGSNFEKWFLGKVEEPFAGSVLNRFRLKKSEVDSSIIENLGGKEKAETTLAEMFALMEMQENGEEGVLLTNGYANIFYIRNIIGVPCVVRCGWLDAGWCVSADLVGDPCRWLVGRQVFSRNSSES